MGIARLAGPLCLLRHCSLPAAASNDALGLPGRHAHWVLRTSDLKRSLEFYKRVLGLRVLRHEENPQSCPITCNGRYDAAWSKTMVGHEPEDRAYALELTYNYGVRAYPPGELLRAIAVRPRVPLAEALAAARDLGYGQPERAGGGSVVVGGPDGYRYKLLPAAGGAGEPFDHVRLRVRDLAKSVDFYTRLLGMREGPARRVQPGPPEDGVRVVGYDAAGANLSVPLVLEASPGGAAVRVEQWEGRHAVTLPAEALRGVYARLLEEAPWSVVHELRELEENLGTLLIAIVRDPDGAELCLVSAEVFDAAVLAAADYAEPDWGAREAAESAAGVSLNDDGPSDATPPWATAGR